MKTNYFAAKIAKNTKLIAAVFLCGLCVLCGYSQTPVLFSTVSLTGTVNNRAILIKPDTYENPLVVSPTQLGDFSPFYIYPVGGQVVTNLVPWGYTIRVDGWPRSAHIVVPNVSYVTNAASLINTNAFSPLNIYTGAITTYVSNQIAAGAGVATVTNGNVVTVSVPNVVTNDATNVTLSGTFPNIAGSGVYTNDLFIHGVDGAPGQDYSPGPVTIRAGNAFNANTGVTDNGGNLFLRAGSAGGHSGQTGGTLTIGGHTNADGSYGPLILINPSGNGSAFTSLNPANLSSGVAGISITGSAASATAAATAASLAGPAIDANNLPYISAYTQPPLPVSGIGAALIPQALNGPGPVAVARFGDSMAQDNNFNGTLFAFLSLLRNDFGAAGGWCLGLDVNYFNVGHQYQCYNRYYNAQAGGYTADTNNPPTPGYLYPAPAGAVIWASDGTNAARGWQGYRGRNLNVNMLGVWWWAQPQGSNFVARIAGPSTNGAVTLNGYAAIGTLMHTNLPVPLSSNNCIYFTALAGTNYIVGWDNLCTNAAGIADFTWSMGGLDLYSIIGGLGTNYQTMMSVIQPQLILFESRDNGPAQTSGTISNWLFNLGSYATNANLGSTTVMIAPPNNSNPPLAYPDAQSIAFRSLAALGPPFYSIYLDRVYSDTNQLSSQSLGWSPHPTLNGQMLSAAELYRQMGFTRPPLIDSSIVAQTSTDNTILTPAQAIANRGLLLNPISENVSLQTNSGHGYTLLFTNGIYCGHTTY